ncbi:phage antirepressor KilAC domain-containing protein [Aeromonas hydrophila]|uniref:phage antirepressor KilAC domain-containing protein n=1 Tax=Aeromonas TaxID=642 RepID=UPI0011181C55|nr:MULTISPECIES: phage antirepressor KilAC domain-containing protein [Aeromonas]MBL0560358.1 phage antirepressor KilAC domain-containing protein [Aeromonas hydrophila]MBM0511399.1 DNA-binding protein [Aeromonas hydrophila]MBW3770985.1 DNA-binding protein [Aeromonas hydrophila]MCX4103559.1 phage antirepressor KilAC domain-containing protein [Aeromonas hydrophila]TNJ17230.1 DNA-binding protein [Aeromonas hydrophila]
MTIQQQYQQTKVLTGPLNSMPVVAGIEITTDEAGRFNLNALHQASGLGAEKAPSKWLRNKQAQELVAEVEKQTGQICIVSIEGRNGGTFAHELLAISYAGWISPAFQLQVNQVFLDYRTGKLTPPAQKEISRKELALMVIQAEEENERLLTENQMLGKQIEETKPKVEALERIAIAEGSLNLTEAAKALQQPPRKFNQHLCSQRWIYKRAGGKQWLGYQDKVQQGLVEHKVTMVPLADGGERLCEQVRITPKGLTRLAQQLGSGGAQ